MSNTNRNDLLMTLTDFPSDLKEKMLKQDLTHGDILYQQGDQAKSLYWVASGQIRLVSLVNSQMVTQYFVNTGEFMGESVLFNPTYRCTSIAERTTNIMAIPVDEFLKALKESPALFEGYLNKLTHRIYNLQFLLKLRSINSLRTRLIHYLMSQRLPEQNTLTLDKPLHAIASELAITPEALSRMLASLQTEGIMTREKRKITFSPEWLDDLAYD